MSGVVIFGPEFPSLALVRECLYGSYPASPLVSTSHESPITSHVLPAEVVERVNEFLRADAGGAEFTHNDAGGGVGKHGSVGKWRTSGNGKRQNAEHGVPGPGDVEDLPAGCPALDTCLAHARVGHFKTRRWNVQMARRGLLKYAHPFFTARDHHCAAAEVREQREPRLFHGFLVRQRARDVETRFLGIAHDGPRSAIRV